MPRAQDLDLVLKAAEDPYLKLLVAPDLAAAEAKPTKRKTMTRFSSVSGHFVLQVTDGTHPHTLSTRPAHAATSGSRRPSHRPPHEAH